VQAEAFADQGARERLGHAGPGLGLDHPGGCRPGFEPAREDTHNAREAGADALGGPGDLQAPAPAAGGLS
jgi:hypothetical protein